MSEEGASPSPLCDAGVVTTGVMATLRADAAVSYASYQNHIPIVHAISVRNETESPVVALVLRLSADPEFCDPIEYRIERLEPGEARDIAPVALKPRHAYLAGLTDTERGTLRLVVFASDIELTRVEQEIAVLAYDEWAGTRSLPELLAAFSLPNNPHVDRLLSEAAGLLQRGTQSYVLNGYDSGSREAVWAQISAIYSAMAARDLKYTMPPASFVGSGQKIRTPDRLFQGGVGTCLDLTMLMVSALEQANLNPLVLTKDGHAWVGCWLVNTSFPSSLVDDPQTVRKRIDSGELAMFESTVLTHRPVPSLRGAQEAARKHIQDDAADFVFALDVRRARQEQIEPLPSRNAAPPDERGTDSVVVAIDEFPALPTLAAEVVLLDENNRVDSPKGRLDRWKSKLLDLTRRNRLLNFKPTKATIPLRVLDAARLEDSLADKAEWRFTAMPLIMEGKDPRSAALAQARSGENPLDTMAHDAAKRHELLAECDSKKLDNALYEIFLSVRNSLEETGANTLFVALGFLRWTEDDNAKASNLAPLILVPVTLLRANVRTGFSIKRHDDDAIVNPALLQMLKENFEINLPALEPPPQDASGLDVERIWAIFREAANKMPKWEVETMVQLGIFSFHKFVMYADLSLRTEALRRNKLVAHLIDRPADPFCDVDIRTYDDIDETHGPGELLTVTSADASQLNALRRAAEGHTFVLQGPPGTGKSQTITNLIADALGKGKRVLFVSEKIAALEVVERRLADAGLAPFCLQLHSSKAVKVEVLGRLKETLNLGASLAPAEWEREIENLASLRRTLNGLVRALHRPHPNGLTVRGAIDVAIRHRAWPARPMALPSIEVFEERHVLQMRRLAGSMEAVAIRLREIGRHPLREIHQKEYTHAWEETLLAATTEQQSAINGVEALLPALTKALGLPLTAPSLRELECIEHLGEVLMTSAAVPPTLANRVHDNSVRRWLEALRRHGEARNQAWQSLSGQFKPDVSRVRAQELQEAWAIASTKWALPRYFGQRAVSTRLMAYTLDAKRPMPDDIPAVLDALDQVNQEDQAIQTRAAEAGQLLDSYFRGIETDWGAVQRFLGWGERLEQAFGAFVTAEQPVPPPALVERVHQLLGSGRQLLASDGAVTGVLVRFRQALRRLRDTSAKLAVVSGNAALAPTAGDATPALLERLAGAVQGWPTAASSLRDWCFWRGAREKAQQAGLGHVIAALEVGAVPVSSFAAYVDYCYQVWWLKGITDRDEALRAFNSADHERQILEFREADERFQALTRQMIRARLAARVPASGGTARGGEMATLSREIQKQRAHIPIRKLIQQTPEVLPLLKPCMLMSPLSVAQYLDPSYPPFDLVLFDESSQITVWDAVGAIARGSQAVLAGDGKQLPPTAFFDRGEDEAAVDGDDGAPPIDLESILDESLASGTPQLSLDWHYRSRHESLITFSNHRYYESRLVTFPSPVTWDQAVRLIQVNGVYGRGTSCTNPKEAAAVVARIVAHFSQEDAAAREKTIGAVTFNTNQSRLIEQLLDAELAKNPELEERIALHGSERVFVKNLESVQGDERDIILFSTTFGEDAAGRRSLNFGPLNNSGGERRLNVAITRAREAVEIYTSLRPEDIDLSRTRANGVRDLKAYLDFALRGPAAIAAEVAPTGREPDSTFEREVIQVLRDAGWEVHPQVGCSGFRIDIGVVDRGAPGSYVIGVECDGATYHGMASARDRDRLRQGVLEGLGWTLTRIWSTDWWTQRQQTAARLLQAVGEAQSRADATRLARMDSVGATTIDSGVSSA